MAECGAVMWFVVLLKCEMWWSNGDYEASECKALSTEVGFCFLPMFHESLSSVASNFFARLMSSQQSSKLCVEIYAVLYIIVSLNRFSPLT